MANRASGRRTVAAGLAALALVTTPLAASAEPGAPTLEALAARLGTPGIRLASLVTARPGAFVVLPPVLSGLITDQPTALPPAAIQLAATLGWSTASTIGLPATGSARLEAADFAGWYAGVAAQAYRDPPNLLLASMKARVSTASRHGHHPPHHGRRSSHPIAQGARKSLVKKVPFEANPGPSLFLLASRDDVAARAAVVRLAGRLNWHQVSWQGFSMYASPRAKDPYFMAAGKGIVALSDSRPWLGRVLARAAGQVGLAHPLAASPVFRATMARLPADGLAFAYLDMSDAKGLASTVPAARGVKTKGPDLPALAFIQSLDAVGAAVRTDSDGVILDSELHYDTGHAPFPEQGPPLDPAAFSAVSRRAIGFLSFSLPHDFARSMFSSPAMPKLPFLTADQFSWLEGDVNLVVMPSGQASPSLPLSGYLALRTPDLSEARFGMQELAGFAQILLAHKDGTPSGAFEPRTIGYSDWQLWCRGDDSTKDLGGYGFGAKDVFVALGDSAIQAAASHSAITDNPDFQAVYRHLPAASSFVAYLDVPKVLDLGLEAIDASPSVALNPMTTTIRKYVRAVGMSFESPLVGPDDFSHGVVFVRLASGWGGTPQ